MVFTRWMRVLFVLAALWTASVSAEEPDPLVAFCAELSETLLEASPSCDAMAEAAAALLTERAALLEAEGARLVEEGAAAEACREALRASREPVERCVAERHEGLAQVFRDLQAYGRPPAPVPSEAALLEAARAFSGVLEGLAQVGAAHPEDCEAQRAALGAWMREHEARLVDAAERFRPILRYEQESGQEAATPASQAALEVGIAAWEDAPICEENQIVLLEVLGRLGL